MSQKIIIILDDGTTAQRDAITEFLKVKAWQTGHWIDDAWIVTGVPDEITTREIWTSLIENPLLKPIKGLVIKLDAEPTYWGGSSTESWSWMAQHFGRADFELLRIAAPAMSSER